MTDNILDLDQLAPEPKKVKLGGKILEVYPPKLGQLIKLMKVFYSLQNVKSKEDLEDAEKVMDSLKEIAPGIEEHDLTIEQMSRLVEFAMVQSNTPPEATQKKGADSPNS